MRLRQRQAVRGLGKLPVAADTSAIFSINMNFNTLAKASLMNQFKR